MTSCKAIHWITAKGWVKDVIFHLHYVFLEANNTFPLIIFADFLEWQEKMLISVLKRYIKDIGWTMEHIMGISPDICSHKIQLDSERKPSIEHQRRLNPPM